MNNNQRRGNRDMEAVFTFSLVDEEEDKSFCSASRLCEPIVEIGRSGGEEGCRHASYKAMLHL